MLRLAYPASRFSAEEVATTPISGTSLADEIAFQIERQILSGELVPGSKLQQHALCEQFGVSRTPVREALRKLQALELIDLSPNRGARIKVPSRKEIEEVFDIRAELEAYAAVLACQRADSMLDAALNETIDQVEIASKSSMETEPTDVQLNTRVAGSIRSFHLTIQEAAGNQRLISIVSQLERMFLGDFCCHVLMRPVVRERLHIVQHGAIRDAIAARNPALAGELMRAHIKDAKTALLDYLDERGFWRVESRRRGRS